MDLERRRLFGGGLSLGALTMLTGYDIGANKPAPTLIAFKPSDDILPTRHGYPFKMRIPTKPGFKNPKFVTTIYVTNQQPRGFWTDRGYNWFSGI